MEAEPFEGWSETVKFGDESPSLVSVKEREPVIADVSSSAVLDVSPEKKPGSSSRLTLTSKD